MQLTFTAKQTGTDTTLVSVFMNRRCVGVLRCGVAEYQALIELAAEAQWARARLAAVAEPAG